MPLKPLGLPDKGHFYFMTTNPLEAAFGFAEPRYDVDDGRPLGCLTRRGLTKREYFAALAMQGFQSANIVTDSDDGMNIKTVAELAVDQADALIAALNGEG